MTFEGHTYIEEQGLERPFASQLPASHLTASHLTVISITASCVLLSFTSTMQFSFTRLFVVLSAVFTLVAATESMKIPENKNATMNVQKMQKNPTVHQVN
ncbi:hypothetical protein GGG16DRAFT_110624 [Schizophyllum commune]